MTQFLINGVETPLPVGSQQTFGALLNHVFENCVDETQAIAAVLVNGQQAGNSDQEALSGISLEEIDTVSVTLRHPREIAAETLEFLSEYLHELSALSIRCQSTAVASGNGGAGQTGEDELWKVVEGLGLLVDSIVEVKRVFKVERIEEIEGLEHGLLDLLRDLVVSVEGSKAGAGAENGARREEILGEVLPKHLERWRTEGIPLLVRYHQESC